MTVALMGGLGLLVLNVSDETSRTVMFGLTVLGSVLAGFALGLPVRRAEKRALKWDEWIALVGGLGGFAFTALAISGLTMLDASHDNWAALLALLIGTFVGTASAMAIPPTRGAREREFVREQKLKAPHSNDAGLPSGVTPSRETAE